MQHVLFFIVREEYVVIFKDFLALFVFSCFLYVYHNALVSQCYLSKCPCSNATKTNSNIYFTASD